MTDVETFYYPSYRSVNIVKESDESMVPQGGMQVERRSMAKEFALCIPKEIEERLARCTGSMRQAINRRLLEIAKVASRRVPPQRTAPKGPPLRFYVFEGYRIFYRLDRGERSVVVLDLRPETA
jgi:hypothetical protein